MIFTPLPPTTMRKALDPKLLGRRMTASSWLGWKALLIALNGEALTDEERAAFTKLTGRSHEPLERVEEFWAVTGRRGGKSYAMAVLIVYLSVFCDYRDVLTAGERPIVLCLSQTQRQARIVFDYVAALFEGTPLLAGLIRQRIAGCLSLRNDIDVEIRAASFRGLRGVTCAAVVCDETAWWFTDVESANPDVEILGALRPSLGTTNGLLIGITTPHGRRGVAYEAWAQHYGEKGDKRILVAQGTTKDFNPSYSQATIDRAMEKDPAFARAEYYGQWRDDVAAFISREAVERLIERGVAMRPPERRYGYVAFVDPAGGSGGDSFTLAIAHREMGPSGPRYIVDLLLETRPPFEPHLVIAEFAQTLKNYRVARVVGDAWAKGFPPAEFKRHGIVYEVSDKTKSDIYLTALPMMMSGQASLIDDPRLVSQLSGLERRAARGDRGTVDHAQNVNAHDDLANACCGALVLSMAKQPMRIFDGRLGVSTGGVRLPTSYGASDVTSWRSSLSSAYEPWRPS